MGQRAGASSERDVGIEFTRVIACFMVVLLHVAASGFQTFGPAWWPSNVYDSFARVCVPLFLMVTGALLLGRREPLPVFLRKRMLRLAPPLLFWSVFYVLWRLWRSDEPFVFQDAVIGIVQGPSSYHLWYLYALIGITLFVPFLRMLWLYATAQEKRFYLLLWLLVSGLPTWQAALGWDADPLITYELSSFFGLVGYLFLGAWVQEARHPASASGLRTAAGLLLFVSASIATVLATAAVSRARGEPDALFYDYLSPFVILAAVGAYQALAWCGERLARCGGGNRMRHAILAVASWTLGIYCIHVWLLEWAMDFIDWGEQGGRAWWGMPLAAVCLFFASALLVALLRRVKWLRHVL